MNDRNSKEPMLELFVFETLQLIEQLEEAVLQNEESGELESSINEIFRVMHTIKGNAAMLLFNHIAELAHSMEDLLHFVREHKPAGLNASGLNDLVLACGDFIKGEIGKIDRGETADGTATATMEAIQEFLTKLKEANPGASPAGKKKAPRSKGPEPVEQSKYYISSHAGTAVASEINLFQATVFFEAECGMEDVRAFSLVQQVKEFGTVVGFVPDDIEGDNDSANFIKSDGFRIQFMTRLAAEESRTLLMQVPFIRELRLELANHQPVSADGSNVSASQTPGRRQINLDDPEPAAPQRPPEEETAEKSAAVAPGAAAPAKISMISVNIQKLDMLMDLVGELVIAESMVTHSSDLNGMELENFQKSARQLHKITNELQDIVMSVRMVPLASTFHKMSRLVRDMCRKLGKQAKLELIGEETEVDKNIIEHLSDPLMHLIRNALDHGLETPAERSAKGKPEIGTITLEAKSAGGEVWISIKDDGQGLNREQILHKARERGLLENSAKTEAEYSDREVFSFVMLPGFSTKKVVTEFSGRGVGMDVVAKNLAKIGGKIVIDSVADQGTTISLKIPLTLAIINGMTVRVGNAQYTIPTTDIKESFRARETDLITDPDGNEMIMIRGECYPIVRLQRLYRMSAALQSLTEGIMVMIENDAKSLCLFADELLGEQQVVVKPLPGYIKKVNGIAGCTILGEGNISLIIDTSGLMIA